MMLLSKICLLACVAVASALANCVLAHAQVGGRQERETRAPGVVFDSPTAEAAEQEVLQETQKRLSKIEKSDPKRALLEYKKFWQGRTPHPSVAIEVALKVTELRLGLKDVQGALFTCDTMQKKYWAHPASVQLALRKAQILVSQKRLDEASTVVDTSLTRLLALGPTSYLHTSGALLNMAQLSAEIGGEEGNRWASELYEGVEQVYLHWLKTETPSRIWNLFEVLQARYQKIGDKRRSAEVLPKAADALLKIKPAPINSGNGGLEEAILWRVIVGQGEEVLVEHAALSGRPEYARLILAHLEVLCSRNQSFKALQLLDARWDDVLTVEPVHYKRLRNLILGIGKSGEKKEDPNYQALQLTLEMEEWARGLVTGLKDLEELAAQNPQGWEREAMLDNQALLLVNEGKYKAARAVLEHPILDFPMSIMLLSTTAYSYYREGNFARARECAEQVVSKAKRLSDEGDTFHEGIDNDAQTILRQIDLWSDKPILVEPQVLSVVLSPENEHGLDLRVAVRTLKNIPLRAHWRSNPSAQVHLGARTNSTLSKQFYFQHDLTVEAPEGVSGALNDVILISSPSIPGFQAQLSVQLQPPPRITMSRKALFFGFLRHGTSSKEGITLSARDTFQISRVESDDPAVEISVDLGNAVQHRIHVALTPSKTNRTGLYSGAIRVFTDVVGQEAIEIPYAGKVK